MRLIGREDEVELPIMITAAQIRAMIQQLSLYKISLDDFEEWFTAASWNAQKVEGSDAAEALQMVGKVELCLAEGERKPYAEFLQDMEAIAGMFRIGEAPVLASAVSAGNVKAVPFKLQFAPSAGADTRFVMELSYTPLQPA